MQHPMDLKISAHILSSWRHQRPKRPSLCQLKKCPHRMISMRKFVLTSLLKLKRNGLGARCCLAKLSLLSSRSLPLSGRRAKTSQTIVSVQLLQARNLLRLMARCGRVLCSWEQNRMPSTSSLTIRQTGCLLKASIAKLVRVVNTTHRLQLRARKLV